MKTVDKNQTLGYTRLNETGEQPQKENTMEFQINITGFEIVDDFSLVHFTITTKRGSLSTAENLNSETGLITDGELNLIANEVPRLLPLFTELDEDGDPVNDDFDLRCDCITPIIEKLDELLAQMPHA